jgi:hypothetical protein
MSPQGTSTSGLPIVKALDFLDPESDGADLLFLSVNATGLSSIAPTQQQSLTIPAAEDFYWYQATLQADIQGAAQTESSRVIPLVNIQIQDVGSQKTLDNLSLPCFSRAGFGERPYRLINPRKFDANTNISFLFTAIIAAGTTYTNLFLTLHGFTRPAGS